MNFIKKILLSICLVGSSICANPPSFEEVYYNWQVRAANAPTVLFSAIINDDKGTVAQTLAEFPSLINMPCMPSNQTPYYFALSIGCNDMANTLYSLYLQINYGVNSIVNR